MNTEYNGQTVAVKSCISCGGGLLECDRFCRWCGVSQTAGLEASDLYAALPTVRLDQTGTGANAGLCRRVSGPLISAVIDGITAGPVAGSERGSVMRTSILALISIPLWLMIILLSPFDAFAAARSLARQV